MMRWKGGVGKSFMSSSKSTKKGDKDVTVTAQSIATPFDYQKALQELEFYLNKGFFDKNGKILDVFPNPYQAKREEIIKNITRHFNTVAKVIDKYLRSVVDSKVTSEMLAETHGGVGENYPAYSALIKSICSEVTNSIGIDFSNFLYNICISRLCEQKLRINNNMMLQENILRTLRLANIRGDESTLERLRIAIQEKDMDYLSKLKVNDKDEEKLVSDFVEKHSLIIPTIESLCKSKTPVDKYPENIKQHLERWLKVEQNSKDLLEATKEMFICDCVTELKLAFTSKDTQDQYEKMAMHMAYKDRKQEYKEKVKFPVGSIISFPAGCKGGLKKVGIVVHADKDRTDVLCLNSESKDQGKLRLDLKVSNKALLLHEIKGKNKVVFESAFNKQQEFSYLSRDTYATKSKEIDKGEFLSFAKQELLKEIVKELQQKKGPYDKQWYDKDQQITYKEVITNLAPLTKGFGTGK